MAKQRIYEDHALTSTEKKRRFTDRAASIDQEMDQLFDEIDWERRNQASQSLLAFIRTYMIGILLDTPPSQHMEEVIREMEDALQQTRPWMVELPRGSGKSSIVECCMLYLAATAKRKMMVIAAQNSRSAQNMLRDIWRPIVEKDSAFVQDFPEVCAPFVLANNSFRRRQTYRDISTDIEKNASSIRFARLIRDGVEMPTSGSCITTRGISGGIRGIKSGTLRPDVVILDDLSTEDTASNPEQVNKLLDIIKKDVLGLSGKGKLQVLMTATPICPDDLCSKIESDVNWKTTKHKAMISWPANKELWESYFRLYDKELALDAPHTESLEFYKANFEKMNEGAELFQPERFRAEDGHISGLQALMEKRHLIGPAAFSSEYQMIPHRESFTIDITPQKILEKAIGGPKLEKPTDHVFTVAAIDINASYAATCGIISFATDTSSKVLYHKLFKMHVDGKLPDAAYDEAIIKKLDEIAKYLVALGIHLDAIVADCGGRNWNAVLRWAKAGKKLYGVSCCGFAGRGATNYNPHVKTRLIDPRTCSVLCGDDKERVVAGAGYRYVLFDADATKVCAQKALLAAPYTPGSMLLYDGDADEHRDIALQVCNERLRAMVTVGAKTTYSWVVKEPHDYNDVLSMAIAASDQYGIGLRGAQRSKTGAIQRQRYLPARKPRVRIV